MFTENKISRYNRNSMFSEGTEILLCISGEKPKRMKGKEILSFLQNYNIAVEKDGGKYMILDGYAVELGKHYPDNRLGSYNVDEIVENLNKFAQQKKAKILALFSVEIFSSGWAKGTNHYGLQWCPVKDF